MRNVRIAAVAFLMAFAVEAIQTAKALEVLVTVDASSIANGTAGFLDFQFNAGGTGAQPATAQIKNFTSSNLTQGAITLDGASSGGPLPADVTIDNDVSYPFNGALQAVTFDTNANFSFIVRLTGPAMNTLSDFSTTFFLNLVGPEPNYDSLLPDAIPHLSITIPQDGSGALVISSVPQITATVVPEPGTVVLAMTGAVVLAAARRKSAISTTVAHRLWGLPTAFVVAHPRDGLMFASPC